MNYLIFDENEDLLEVLNFNSEEALNIFKKDNPNYTVKDETVLVDEVFDEDYFYEDDEEDYDDEW